MERKEMDARLKIIEADYYNQKKAIYKEYALSNNPYKVGDIITDHYKTIKIEIIGVYVSNGEPSCQYTGIQLNKDGKPSKTQKDNTIYQFNIVEK